MYLNRTNFRADLISRGQKNRISRGFNFANLVFSKTSRGFNFANSGFLKISRGFNFANSVLKQIFTKHLNIVKILKERRKMIYCHQYQESCFFFRVTGHCVSFVIAYTGTRKIMKHSTWALFCFFNFARI